MAVNVTITVAVKSERQCHFMSIVMARLCCREGGRIPLGKGAVGDDRGRADGFTPGYGIPHGLQGFLAVKGSMISNIMVASSS